MLAKLLAYGQIRVLTNVGKYPTFSVEDVRAALLQMEERDEENSKAARATRSTPPAAGNGNRNGHRRKK
jgi:hypothetical protein